MNKIIITSTENSGCTFLFRLLILLNFDTGFDPKKIEKYTSSQLNSDFDSQHVVMKNALFAHNITKIGTKIEHVVIPIRTKIECLTTSNYSEFHDSVLSKLITDCVTNDINTILLNFHRMIYDSKYLYYKLYSITSKFSFSEFLDAYAIASSLSASMNSGKDIRESFVLNNVHMNIDPIPLLQLPSYEEIVPPNSVSNSPLQSNLSSPRFVNQHKKKKNCVVIKGGITCTF